MNVIFTGKALAAFVFIFLMSPVFAQEKINLKSPDGKLVFSFKLQNGEAIYNISYKRKQLITDSKLGLIFKESGELGKNLTVSKPVFNKVDSYYDLVVGKAKTVHEVYNEVRIPMIEKTSRPRRIDLIARIFNDGLAYRYEFPEQTHWKEYTLIDENSTFDIAGDPGVRTLLFNTTNNAHEGLYEKMPLSKMKEGPLMDLPALFEFSDGIYMAITEANLRDYAGMYLSKKQGILKSQLSPWQGQQEIKVKATLPHKSPWRVMMISDRIGALIESNILTSLNDPPKQKDYSWLKPGKTSFHWWNGDVVPDTTFAPGANFETNKYYIDFCARNNIEYHSVIGYGGFAWYPNDWINYAVKGNYSDVTKSIPSLDMKQICDYARSKGVNIHVWINWMALYPQLEEAFTQFEKWGIKGMMVDFLDRDDQEMVRIQEEILERAAAHHLFIQFHGAYKPTGLHRTYPNELTREGTWNYEQNKWLPAPLSAEHDLDIAFTRLLAGAADYHLGGFNAARPDQFKTQYVKPMMGGTRCHMLAMYVVLESYLAMVADYPKAYEGQAGFEFIKQVPTVWDETRVLQAELNGFLTVARRKGNDWYVGTINNNNSRTLHIPLDFLPAGTYDTELYADGPETAMNPNKLLKSSRVLKTGDVVTVKLEPGGGHAMRLVKKNPTHQKSY